MKEKNVMHLACATQIMYGFTCNEGHLDTILRNESLTFHGTSAYKPSPVTYKHPPVIQLPVKSRV